MRDVWTFYDFLFSILLSMIMAIYAYPRFRSWEGIVWGRIMGRWEGDS